MKKLTTLAVLLVSAVCSVVAQPKDRVSISNEPMKFETMEFDVPLHTYQFDFDANGNYYTTTGNQMERILVRLHSPSFAFLIDRKCGVMSLNLGKKTMNLLSLVFFKILR